MLPASSSWAQYLLRWLPPPRRWEPLLRRFPVLALQRPATQVANRALAGPLSNGLLQEIHGRRIGIGIDDLGLNWVFSVDADTLRAVEVEAECWVRGSATDLALLASRQEDADTLFFQRRLRLTGDIELGLTVRNLLDQLPWASLPLALRIGLTRAARLLAAAREAHRSVPDPAA